MAQQYKGEFQEGPAASAVISLSQALLAPLNSIFKAQVHSARSFLNMVLQMGYPHLEVDENGNSKMPPEEIGNQKMYLQQFMLDTDDGSGNKKLLKMSVPALSLVPISPLAVENAEFSLDFKVSHVYASQQIQSSEHKITSEEKKNTDFDESKRPWYLVSEPVSLRGVIAPGVSAEVKNASSDQEETNIKINIKIGRLPMPAGLDKLLTTMNQITSISPEKSV